MPTQVPIPIPAGPPVPDANTPVASFDLQFEASLAWQKDVLAPGANALAQTTFVNANDAKGSADIAANLAQEVEAARDLTLAAAASAVQSPGAMATSTSSLEVGGGTKVLTLVEAGKDFAPGQTVVAAYTPNPTINMLSLVLAYDKPSKLLTLGVTVPAGAGTYADWTISVSAGQTPLPRYAYVDRGLLRTAGGAAGAGATVEGLGLFIYTPGSTEPDDDESCFATGSGRWLLEAASFDLVHAWLAPVLEQIPVNVVGAVYGSGNCAITTISANTQVSFNVFVEGAEVNDRVIATPPIAMIHVMSFLARVTSSGVVTIYLNNANPNTFSAAGPIGTWYVTVFKENT